MKKTKKKESLKSTETLLVNAKISQWAGRKIDKDATEKVMSSFSATKEAGNYHKKLLPAAEELTKISAIATRFRKYFYEQTLPWFADGTRIISGDNYLDFVKEQKKMTREFESAVSAFCKAYPQLQKLAQQKLGKLYDKEEYPDKDDISARFGIEVTFMPMPQTEDFRINISEEAKKDLEAKIIDAQAKGLNECWTRLHDSVKTAVERLGNKDARFRDALIDNITEIVNLMPKLNITKDKNLDKSCSDIKEVVSKLNGKTLRESAPARSEAHDKLKKAMNNMGAYMGKR